MIAAAVGLAKHATRPLADWKPMHIKSSRPRPWLGIGLAICVVALVAVPIMQKTLVGSYAKRVPILVIAIAAVALMSRFWRGAQLFQRNAAPGGFLLAYLMIALVSTWINPVAPGTWQATTLMITLGTSILALGLACDDRDRRVVVNAIVITAIIEAAHGLLEVVTGVAPIWGYYYQLDATTPAPDPFKSEVFAGAVRAQGSLGHPLLLAYLILIAIALVVGMKPWRRSLNTSTVVFLYAAMFATGSRSGIAIASLVLLFSARTAWKRYLIGIYGLAWILLLSFWFDLWSSDVLRRFSGSGSLAHRSDSLRALERVLEQDAIRLLIGNGINSTDRLYLSGLFTGNFFAVDNQFVSALALTGVLGTAAALGFLLWGLMRGDRKFRWANLAVLAMFGTFEVLVWPSSYAIMVCLVALSSPLKAQEIGDGHDATRGDLPADNGTTLSEKSSLRPDAESINPTCPSTQLSTPLSQLRA